MRTIAGQVQGYLFPNLNILSSLESTFIDSWAKQIGGGAKVEAKNIGGNEHFGAQFGGSAPFPDTAQDIAMPAGAVMAVQYSVDSVLEKLSAAWAIMMTQNGRVKTKNLDPFYVPYGIEPSAGAPIELKSLAISAQGTTWKTVIKGVYHVGHTLPDLSFSITFPEQITADAGAAPNQMNLRYQAMTPTVDADTTALKVAVGALAAVSGGLATVFTVPLFALGLDQIDQALINEMASIRQTLNVLQIVMTNMPQRIRVPASFDNLIFHYDGLTLPQGPIAASTPKNDGVAPTSPGAMILFTSAHKPVRTPRVTAVMIEGLAKVSLPKLPHPNENQVHVVAQIYRADINDEPENPTFHWTVVTPPGAAATVQISNPTAQQIQLLFNEGQHFSPDGKYTLNVAVDDALHLKDALGHSPAATMGLMVSQVTLPVVTDKGDTRPLTKM